MPASGFPITPPHLIIYHSYNTPQYTTYTNPRHILIPRVPYQPVMRPIKVVQKLKMGHSSTSIHYIAGPKCLSCNKGWH